jgi:hypothetical protein
MRPVMSTNKEQLEQTSKIRSKNTSSNNGKVARR